MILFHGGYVQNTCLGRQFQYGNSLLAVDDGSGIQRPLDGNWDIALLTMHCTPAFSPVFTGSSPKENGAIDGGTEWHWRERME